MEEFPTFYTWMNRVHTLFIEFFGITADDVEDWLWMDEYNNDATPMQAFLAWKEENA